MSNRPDFGKVCVIGLGYIGLPTASLLAIKGFKVLGVDIDKNKVDTINRGEVPIEEPDLDIMVRSAVQSGNLKASTVAEEADVYIIAVPTPFKNGFQPDMAYVEEATRAISKYIRPGNLVILESTSPVGTTEQIAAWIREMRSDLSIPQTKLSSGWSSNGSGRVYFAHCPERVLPGQILKELVDNDRIVGGVDQASSDLASQFYEKFVNGRILKTNARTAELSKLTENAFRDVNIAFANELSLICDHLNIDVWELIGLANCHPRVKILQPGPGVGGHCIAVDPWFIVSSAPDQAKLIRTARQVNDAKPHFVSQRVVELAARFKNPKIAFLGLSYKADVGDLRESPAIEIVSEVAKKITADIFIVEPFVTELPTQLHLGKNLKLVDLEFAARQADVLVLLVDHREFKNIDRGLLQEKMVVDTRGLWR